MAFYIVEYDKQQGKRLFLTLQKVTYYKYKGYYHLLNDKKRLAKILFSNFFRNYFDYTFLRFYRRMKFAVLDLSSNKTTAKR